MSSYRITKLPVQEICTTFLPVAKHPTDSKEVGRRVNILLAALGWQATQLATAVGITPQLLNNYTSGRNKLPPHVAEAICAVTGVDFDYLHRGRLDRLPSDLQGKIIKARKEAA